MTPLGTILNWWEGLEGFPREHIAADICLRLIPQADARNAAHEFSGFLTEEMPGNWHLGRVLAVRSVIDFWFFCDERTDAVIGHLENVEKQNVRLKSLSNAALGRMPRVRKAVDNARDTWRPLRAGMLSDASLLSLERKSSGQPPLP